jgi:hypothetical protein
VVQVSKYLFFCQNKYINSNFEIEIVVLWAAMVFFDRAYVFLVFWPKTEMPLVL